MKIFRLNSLSDGGKTAAFFDIQTPDGIVIKGFRLIKGKNGLFVSPPDEKGKDGKYYDTVLLPQKIKDDVEKLAIEEYNKTLQ